MACSERSRCLVASAWTVICRPRMGEGVEIGVDRLDHQVAVERLVAVRPQGRHQRRPEGDVGHEMAVHHVEVDPVGPAAAMSRTSWPRLAKSANRIDGERTKDRSNALMKLHLRLGGIVVENRVRFQAARPAKPLKAASRRVN